MYEFLYISISKALAALNSKDAESFDNAVKILKDAQCKADEIAINAKQFNQYSSPYSSPDPTYIQTSVGSFMKEDSIYKSKKELVERLNRLPHY